MPLRQPSQSLEKNIFLSFRPEIAVKLQPATKQQSSSTSPVQLLVNYKSTPTSIAAATVDKAVRSVVHPDVSSHRRFRDRSGLLFWRF
jgi:hypothetical protein